MERTLPFGHIRILYFCVHPRLVRAHQRYARNAYIMITLYPEEKIIQAVHRHWIAIANKMTIVVLLLIIPAGLLFLLPRFSLPEFVISLLLYLLSLYCLFVSVMAFGMWIDYYLDIWIITNKRIIAIEQKGVFNREVSEFTIDRIEDVTTYNPNFISLFLKYGTIEVHTAGEKTFFAHDVPDVKKIKDVIINIKMNSAMNHQ